MRATGNAFRIATSFALPVLIAVAGVQAVAQSVAQAAPEQSARLLDPIPPGRIAQEFSLPDVHGHMHALKEYRGRFVLIAFWSANCLICVEEISDMEAAYRLLRDGVARDGAADAAFEVIAIHAGAESPKMREVLAANPPSYAVLVDEDLKMGGWGVPALPTVYLVGPKGELLYRAVGARDWGAPRLLNRLRSIISSSRQR